MSSGEHAVLVINPNAGRLPHSRRAEVADAMRRHFDVEVICTTARDSAIGIARRAAEEGARLVVAFGGDGVVNEVANGIVGTDATLGVIPGGTMNVLARSLGIPLDPFEAVVHLSDAGKRSPRSIPLGKVDERYFTFASGCGFDAEAAERVERYLSQKRRFGQAFFYWSAFRVLTGSYRHRSPSMVLTGPFGQVPVAMAIVSNAGPYAYLMNRPIRVAPDVSLQRGIDVFALKSMRIEALPLYAWRSVVSGDLVHHPDSLYASDVEWAEISSEQPFKRHVDGEPLSTSRSSRFSVQADALRVRA